MAGAPNLIPVTDTSEGLYLVAIKVRSPFGKVGLKSEKIRQDHVSTAIKENGGTIKDSVPIYEIIKTVSLASGKSKARRFGTAAAAITLANRLDALQREVNIVASSSRWWYFPASRKEVFDEQLAQTQELASQLKEELLEIYDEAKKLYLERIENILCAAGCIEEYYKYAVEFPSKEQVEESFGLEIEGPVPLSSLITLAQQAPEMQRWMDQTYTSLAQDAPKILDKMGRAIADHLRRLGSVDPVDLSSSQADMLSANHTNLKSLISLYGQITARINGGAMNPIAHLADRVLSIPFSEFDRDRLQVELIRLQTELMAEPWVKDPETAGAGEIAKWCGLLSIEERIKALKEAIAKLDDPSVPEEEREAKRHELRLEARTYNGILLTTARKLLEVAGIKNVLDLSEDVSDFVML